MKTSCQTAESTINKSLIEELLGTFLLVRHLYMGIRLSTTHTKPNWVLAIHMNFDRYRGVPSLCRMFWFVSMCTPTCFARFAEMRLVKKPGI